MRFTPGGAVGVALPVACVAPRARDAPRSACAHRMRALCLSAGAWSPLGSFGKVDGRDAGDRVLGSRAGIAAGMSSAPVARWGVAKVGDARAAAFVGITPRARPMFSS